MVLENAIAAPRILELGCGAGVPITRMLLDRGAQVVANDISTKQISLAKVRCSEATFVPGDMAALTFEPASFDGVVAFYSIFHLPRAEQKGMLSKICSWLKPGGLFVLNLATEDNEEIYGEFLGHGMFWSSFSVEDSKEMVKGAGFELAEAEVLEAGDGKLDESDPDYGVKFLWIAAKRPPSHQVSEPSAKEAT
jgi:SAM-dependent methyltransferase